MRVPVAIFALCAVCMFVAAASVCAAAASDEVKAPTALVEAGRARFGADCGFCHGKDAAGASTGPDLTHSDLVKADKDGDLVINMVRSGKPDAGMPAFATLQSNDLTAIVAFIHEQQRLAATEIGARRAVDAADLAVGNADKGKLYFDKACGKCHSAGGDLAGIGTRVQGLTLLRRMLYPGSESRTGARKPPAVTVTTPAGQHFTGALFSYDEFTLAMLDNYGVYHSWPIATIEYLIDDPLLAHVAQLARYTDSDMHDVFAYLQTLK
jgi:cytochrome c oxidase cbb3-type subunit 3